MAATERPREGDYVKAVGPPRLGLVLSVRTRGTGTSLLIEDAARDCDGGCEPEWLPASEWTTVRPAGPVELADAA